jgi:hypothetical protein
MNTTFLNIIPVLPSADVERDIAWYKEKTGFKCLYKDNTDDGQRTSYAVLGRNNQYIHLQWHAGTEDDPLLGGSVIRIYVKHIKPLVEEFVQRGTITQDKFRTNSPWQSNEFGFYDLNHIAIFIMEDLTK